MQPTSLATLASLTLSGLALTACGGGGGGNTPTTTPAPDVPLEDVLADLGVDMTDEPRVDDQGSPLPEDYSPFGETWDMQKTTELYLGGVQLTGQDSSALGALMEDQTGEEDLIHWDDLVPLKTWSNSEMPFLQQETGPQASPTTSRDAVAADVDGDRIEELVHVYDDGGTLYLRIDDWEEGSTPLVALPPVVYDLPYDPRDEDARQLELAAGDVDADGKDELVLGVASDTMVWLRIIDVKQNGITVEDDGTDTTSGHAMGPFTNQLAGGVLSLSLSTGNVDHDPRAEIALAVNEEVPVPYLGHIDKSGTARWMLYDDASTDHDELLAGDFTWLSAGAGATIAAEVGNITLGDVDGDSLDEIVLGGLRSFTWGYENPELVARVLDDVVSSNGQIVELDNWHREVTTYPDNSNTPGQLEWIFLGTPDLDGDGIAEFYLNEFAFHDLAGEAPITEIDVDEAFFLYPFTGYTGDLHATRQSTKMAWGDTDRDGRDEVMIYRQQRNMPNYIYTRGLDQEDDQGVWSADKVQVRVQTSVNLPRVPLLVPINVDLDSPILRRTQAEHELVFTEPTLIAVMAVPPYYAGIDQGATTTSFGNTTFNGNELESSVTATWSASAGFKFENDLTQSEVNFKKTATTQARLFVSASYQRSETIVYTTGTEDDYVVFSTVPMDRYRYRVVSHEDPEMLGKEVIVDLPRSNQVLFVERSYYNDRISDGIRITDEILGHTVGDPFSYPTSAEKNTLRDLYGGEQSSGAITVAQGGGTLTREIQVQTAVSAGGSLEVNYTKSLEVTGGGAMAGFEVGTGIGAGFKLQSGSATTYSGTVGGLPTDAFEESPYRFGMFTYVRELGGQQFQVLTYWVTPVQ